MLFLIVLLAFRYELTKLYFVASGESKSLGRLLEYVGNKWGMPSDTAVRNAVAGILIELHDELVKELSVRRIFVVSTCMQYLTFQLF